MNLGIDFGTSYTKLGYISDDGRFINLAGPQGMLPSVVAFEPGTRRLFFAWDALSLPGGDAEVARYFKIELKRNPGFRLGDFGLNDILQAYFGFLRDRYVAGQIPRPPRKVTVGVPNYFGLKSRRILLESARSAFPGAEVELVLEPVAALVGLLAEEGPGGAAGYEGNILILDLGGGTADASFIHVGPGRELRIVLEGQLNAGSDLFSGAEVDRTVLRQVLFPLFEGKTGTLIPPRFKKEKGLNREELYQYSRMLKWAEEVKLMVQDRDVVSIDIPSFYQGRSLSAVLEKRELSPIFERTLSALKVFMEETVKPAAEGLGLFRGGKWDVDVVVLTGGVSRMEGVENIASGVAPRVIRSRAPEFSVIQGLCRWPLSKETSSPLEVKSLLPFRFYIEKKGGDSELELIPFDTVNLELDAHGVYRLCAVYLDSVHNLSEESGKVTVRIYQGGEAQDPQEVRTDPEGLVLEESRPVQGDEPLEVWLDLSESLLTVGEEPGYREAGVPGGVESSLWENGLAKHRETAARALGLKLGRPEVREHYGAAVKRLEKGQPFQNFDEAVKAKLLLFLDMLPRWSRR